VRAIEHQWARGGEPTPLADVLVELLYRRNLTHVEAAEELGVDPVTLWRWRKRLDAAEAVA
jgi:hypothetical protein